MESTSRLFAASPKARDQDEPTEEDALVEAAKRDPAAFATLYQRYFARVYRYLRIRLRSEEDAADLTQQVFLKALDALPRYQSRRAPFAAWLFTIARRTLADRFRRRPVTLPLEAAGDLLADHEMEAAVLRRESIEQLTALLGSLNPDARDLLALRFAAGLTTPEIAAILGKRPEAVRKALSRLLQSLKEQYHAPH
ncbi:MAG TPA: sigma-70 family RNA polymerase sigma factor [Ktedonobacterales bacterium]|nr:sigma-70 family RNA polymerase sigma factor [Ktedonobacterales bacterium]